MKYYIANLAAEVVQYSGPEMAKPDDSQVVRSIVGLDSECRSKLEAYSPFAGEHGALSALIHDSMNAIIELPPRAIMAVYRNDRQPVEAKSGIDHSALLNWFMDISSPKRDRVRSYIDSCRIIAAILPIIDED